MMATILDLPNELIDMIFQLLNLEDLLSVGLVCRQFASSQVTLLDCLGRIIINETNTDELKQMIDKFTKHCIDSQTTAQSMDQLEGTILFQEDNQISRILIDGDETVPVECRKTLGELCPNVKQLIISSFILDELQDIGQLITVLPGLRMIKLIGVNNCMNFFQIFSDFNDLPAWSFSHLEHLSVSSKTTNVSHEEPHENSWDIRYNPVFPRLCEFYIAGFTGSSVNNFLVNWIDSIMPNLTRLGLIQAELNVAIQHMRLLKKESASRICYLTIGTSENTQLQLDPEMVMEIRSKFGALQWLNGRQLDKLELQYN